MTDPHTTSRPKKLDHLDTIRYEIRMLSYCYEHLRRGEWPDRESYHLSIEGFLLHYRNLAEFFSSTGDLKANEPDVWAQGRKLTDTELASILNERLDHKYKGQISQYLSHCTKSRADRDRSWDIVEMYEDIGPSLENFRSLL
jgi:hypothetical protein